MSNEDSLEPKLTELKVGYTLDYNLKTWIVEEVYHYRWGNNFSSIEYKIYSGDEQAYLEVEDDDELKILFSKDIDLPLSRFDFLPDSDPKPELQYNGKTYFFHEMFDAQARNDEDDYWESFYLWDYFDEEEKEFISIENWDGDLEACHGHKVDELEISSVTPGDPNRVRERKLNKKYGYDTTYDESQKTIPVKIIFTMILIIVLIIIMSRGCGGGTYIHTGTGRYIHHVTPIGGGGSWSGGGGGGFRGGGGGFGK